LNGIGLRSALRHNTQDEHDRLDAQIGDFSDLQSYRSFLVGSYRFRKCLEPATSTIGFWNAELEDLGAGIVSAPVTALRAETQAEQLGLLYVLEGSALGARILFRRAELLGFTQTHGARHLAGQVSDPRRWRNFLTMLESLGDIDQSLAIRGARACFTAALTHFIEVQSEPSQFA
jgi:heme oxygenase